MDKKKKFDFGIIIEARVGSSRFPGKILKKINNKTILEILIDRLEFKKENIAIVVATTTKSKDDAIVKICQKNEIHYFRGPENNIPKRVYLAAVKFNIANIIQVTSDQPLMDKDLIVNAIKIYKKKKLNFLTNNYPEETFPKGMWINIIKSNLFKKMFKKKLSASQKEHLSQYFRDNIKKLKYFNIMLSKKMQKQNLRITLDYPEDLKLIKVIINNFKNFKFKYKDIISLTKKKPLIMKINKKYI